jgi:hypothetical protein
VSNEHLCFAVGGKTLNAIFKVHGEDSLCVTLCVCVCVLRGGVFLAHTGPVLGSSAFFQWFQPFSLGVRAKSGI